jgi:hypothetical protein
MILAGGGFLGMGIALLLSSAVIYGLKYIIKGLIASRYSISKINEINDYSKLKSLLDFYNDGDGANGTIENLQAIEIISLRILEINPNNLEAQISLVNAKGGNNKLEISDEKYFENIKNSYNINTKEKYFGDILLALYYYGFYLTKNNRKEEGILIKEFVFKEWPEINEVCDAIILDSYY